jgi:hypothetical protein
VTTPPKPPAQVLADNEALKLPVQEIELPVGQGPFQTPKATRSIAIQQLEGRGNFRLVLETPQYKLISVPISGEALNQLARQIQGLADHLKRLRGAS